MGTARMLGRGGDGPPVYTYAAVPGVPPVSVARLGGRESPEGSTDGTPDTHAQRRSHSHDFLLLLYFERSGGSLRLGERRWPVETGDAYIIAPSEVVGIGEDDDGLVGARGWTVFFPPEVLGDQAPGSFLSWRAHPLLFPFVKGVAGGAQRLKVPLEEQDS
ncbi:MAG: AraC family ligand binding domain-containing protein [Rubrobacter sp.]